MRHWKFIRVSEGKRLVCKLASVSSNITASGVLHNITVSDRTVSFELSARSDNSTHSAHGKVPLVPQQPLLFKMQGYYYIKVDRHAVKIGEVASFSKAVAILLMTFYVSVNDMKTQKEFQRIYADVSNTCDKLGISCLVAQGKRKKSRPAAMQNFLTNSSYTVVWNSAEEEQKNELRVDFFLPVYT